MTWNEIQCQTDRVHQGNGIKCQPLNSLFISDLQPVDVLLHNPAVEMFRYVCGVLKENIWSMYSGSSS